MSPRSRALKKQKQSGAWERIWNRLMGSEPRQRVGYKPRRLVMDQLEERTLLSVVPTGVTDQLINQSAMTNPAITPTVFNSATTTDAMLAGKSVASDNNGDFVAVWSQNDGVYDANGNVVIDQNTKQAMTDDNVYASYYTQAMQRIDLPVSAASFQVRDSGNEIQELTIDGGTAPYGVGGNNVGGTFSLSFGSYRTALMMFNETRYTPAQNAVFIQQALNNLGNSTGGPAALQDVTVQAIDADHYYINFGPKSNGQVQPLLTTTPTTTTTVNSATTTVAQVIGASDTVITVADYSQFPLAQLPAVPFEIQVGNELMSVTGYNSNDPSQWTVTRTAPVAHAVGTNVGLAISATQTTITVANAARFPVSNSPFTSFVIQVDREQMLVTGVGGVNDTTWTVQRGYNSTTAAAHAAGATVSTADQLSLTGFLPAVTATAVRTPGTTISIQVSNNPSLTAQQNSAQTAQNIEYAFAQTTTNERMAPVFFPSSLEVTEMGKPGGNNGIGPYTTWETLPVALPGVSVIAQSATEFDITFTGDNGYQDQPLLSVIDPSSLPTNPLPLAGASAMIIKQSSGTFRVNDPEPLYNPATMNRPQVYNQLNAQVAMDPDGDFVITWQSYTPNSVIAGSGYDIYARRFSPSGYVSTEQTIQITPNTPGRLSFQFTVTTGRGTTGNINFSAGNIGAAATALQTALINLGYDPATQVTAVLQNGSYLLEIAWGGADADPPVPPLVTFTATSTMAATVTVSNNVPFLSDMPTSIAPTTGAIIHTRDNAYQQVPIQCVVPLGGQFQVNTTTANDQTMPSVAMDGSGNFTIAWESQGQPLSFFNNIEAQRYDRDGNRVGNEFMVNSVDLTTTDFDPYVGMANDGTFAITWSDTADPNYIVDGGTGYSSAVEAKVYDPQGNILVGQFSPGGAGFSTIAFDSNDDFAISWQESTTQDNIAGDGGYSDVFAQEYQLYDPPPATRAFDFKVIRPTVRLNSANTDPTQKDFWPFSQNGAQVALDADGDLTASYSGFGPAVSETNVAQTEINSIVGQQTYSQEQITITYQPIYYTLNGVATSGLAVGEGYCALSIPGIGTTGDIDFNPGDLATTATNIQTALNKLLQANGYSQTVTVTSTGSASPSFTFLVQFSTAVGATQFPSLLFVNATSADVTIPAAINTKFLDVNTVPMGTTRVTQDNSTGLLAGEANGAMFSQFDADPRLSAGVLTSDDVANADRDGQDATYYIDIDPLAVSGSFDVDVTVDGITQTASITPAYFPGGGTVDPVNTGKAIAAAIAKLTNVGVNWPVADGYNGPVMVELVNSPGAPAGSFSQILGSTWDPTAHGLSAQNYIYRVTFMGEVHDTPVAMSMSADGICTLARKTSATATQQILHFGTTVGWFSLSLSNAQTADMQGPPDPTTIATELGKLLPTGVTVTVTQLGGSGDFLCNFSVPVPILTASGPNTKTNTPAMSPTPIVAVGGLVSPKPVIAQELQGMAGTAQDDASIGMTSGGSFVEVWTEQAQTSSGSTSNTNFYFRTFQETTDTAGPLVTDLVDPNPTSGGRLQDGQTVTDPLSSLVVDFDSQMLTTGPNSVTNPANWSLLLNGVVQTGAISAIYFGMNEAALNPLFAGLDAPATNKWQAVIVFNGGALQDGHYQLVATTALRDANGNALGRNGFQPNGAPFSRTFNVVLPTGGETLVNSGSVASTTLTSSISDTATMLTVGSTGGFPAATPFAIAVDGEQMLVQTASGTTLTVLQRGYNQTLVVPHLSGATVASSIVYGTAAMQWNQLTSEPNAQTVASDANGDYVTVWTSAGANSPLRSHELQRRLLPPEFQQHAERRHLFQPDRRHKDGRQYPGGAGRD